MNERFTMTIEVVRNGDERPPIIRLRSLLKLMRRGFGLRCLEINEQSQQPVLDNHSSNADNPQHEDSESQRPSAQDHQNLRPVPIRVVEGHGD